MHHYVQADRFRRYSADRLGSQLNQGCRKSAPVRFRGSPDIGIELPPSEPRGVIPANASGDLSACETRGKYFRLCHSKICHEPGRERFIRRFLLFRLLGRFQSRVRFDRLFHH